VDQVVQRRIAERRPQAQQDLFERLRQRETFAIANGREIARMRLRHDPRFIRHARRERGDHREGLVLEDQPFGGQGRLLPDDIAENATALEIVVFCRAGQFLLHPLRRDRRGDELRVRMGDRGAGQVALVLEDQDILEAVIAGQVGHARPIGVHDRGDVPLGQVGQLHIVVGRLGDDLMRADAGHLVEHADPFPRQLPLDAQHGIFVRQHAHLPAGRVGGRARRAHCKDLARGERLLAAAKHARRGLPLR
jgi:hypothetical protein